MVAREQPVKECGPRAAHMQETGGRRRKANPDGRTHDRINSKGAPQRNPFFNSVSASVSVSEEKASEAWPQPTSWLAAPKVQGETSIFG